MSETKELTIGEKRVRPTHRELTVAEKVLIEDIKSQSAKLIDTIEKYKDSNPRLASLAQTSFEEGTMWAVKCITSEKQ